MTNTRHKSASSGKDVVTFKNNPCQSTRGYTMAKSSNDTIKYKEKYRKYSILINFINTFKFAHYFTQGKQRLLTWEAFKDVCET